MLFGIAKCAVQPPRAQSTGQLVRAEAPQAVRVPALDPHEALARGQRIYRQSCVYCHGIQPHGLSYRDVRRFREVVMQGSEQMPALGFKLTVQEIDLIRRYIERCAADDQVCSGCPAMMLYQSVEFLRLSWPGDSDQPAWLDAVNEGLAAGQVVTASARHATLAGDGCRVADQHPHRTAGAEAAQLVPVREVE